MLFAALYLLFGGSEHRKRLGRYGLYGKAAFFFSAGVVIMAFSARARYPCRGFDSFNVLDGLHHEGRRLCVPQKELRI
jgi:hypothetical protein